MLFLEENKLTFFPCNFMILWIESIIGDTAMIQEVKYKDSVDFYKQIKYAAISFKILAKQILKKNVGK